MAGIYEALENAARDKKGFGTAPKMIHEAYAPSDPSSLGMEEEMLGLFKNIDILLPDSPQKIIQFIGCRGGEGVSTVVREFAQVAASKIGRSVLLLDADRLTPTHHHHFGIRYECGWQDAVRDEALLPEVLHPVPHLNLSVGPSSNSCAATPEIFDSLLLKNFWQKVRERFDLVLIDSPPLDESPDGLAIAQMVQGVVLVLEAEKTHWAVAKNLKQKILRAGGNILGVVLNKRRYYIPQFIYNKL